MSSISTYEDSGFAGPHNDPDFESNESWNALVAVATKVLGLLLYIYQCEILRAVMLYPRVACVASRQIGKSVAIAILALTWALSIPDQTVVIISTGERQVKELLTKRNFSIKKMFKRAGKNAHISTNIDLKSMISTMLAQSGLQLEFQSKHENAEEIEFKNGSRIVVVPANPDTASGFTANLLIGDEIAKMPNWAEMQAACFPFVTRTEGKIALFSSYKGKNHWWNITCDKVSETNPKGWKVLTYPVTVNPPPDLDQLKHDLPLDTYMEEYMCIPIEEAHSMFPFSLLDGCATGDFEEW